MKLKTKRIMVLIIFSMQLFNTFMAFHKNFISKYELIGVCIYLIALFLILEFVAHIRTKKDEASQKIQ